MCLSSGSIPGMDTATRTWSFACGLAPFSPLQRCSTCTYAQEDEKEGEPFYLATKEGESWQGIFGRTAPWFGRTCGLCESCRQSFRPWPYLLPPHPFDSRPALEPELVWRWQFCSCLTRVFLSWQGRTPSYTGFILIISSNSFLINKW